VLPREEAARIQVNLHWRPFYSLDPELVLKRARTILSPPDTITLELARDTLVVRGQASQAWINRMHQWGGTIPGIHGLDSRNIHNLTLEKLKATLEPLRKIQVYFKSNRFQFTPGQEKVLEQIAVILKTAQSLQPGLKTLVQILILGHTDSSGNERVNLALSRNRAQTLYNYLILQGVNPGFLTLSGMGTQMPVSQETSEKERQINRTVTFKIFYTPLTQGS
jgi:OOP family OmpA-OmpF porin